MRVVALVAVACGGLLGLARAGVKVTPPETKSGLTCRVSGATVTTTLTLEDAGSPAGERRHELVVSLMVGGGGAYALEQAVITEALDEQEQDIRVPRQTSPQPAEHQRQVLESMFANALQRDPRNAENVSAQAYLTRCPEGFQRVSGVLPGVVAKRLVRERVELKETAEAVEIAPGVTFLMSKVRAEEGSTTVTYEARVRRGREGVRPGLEPVFAGLVLRDAQGQTSSVWHYPQPVETRDEYIYVVKDVGVPRQLMERGGTLEACVFAGLERVEFKFGVSDLEVVTAAKGVSK